MLTFNCDKIVVDNINLNEVVYRFIKGARLYHEGLMGVDNPEDEHIYSSQLTYTEKLGYDEDNFRRSTVEGLYYGLVADPIDYLQNMPFVVNVCPSLVLVLHLLSEKVNICREMMYDPVAGVLHYSYRYKGSDMTYYSEIPDISLAMLGLMNESEVIKSIDSVHLIEGEMILYISSDFHVESIDGDERAIFDYVFDCIE